MEWSPNGTNCISYVKWTTKEPLPQRQQHHDEEGITTTTTTTVEMCEFTQNGQTIWEFFCVFFAFFRERIKNIDCFFTLSFSISQPSQLYLTHHIFKVQAHDLKNKRFFFYLSLLSRSLPLLLPLLMSMSLSLFGYIHGILFSRWYFAVLCCTYAI